MTKLTSRGVHRDLAYFYVGLIISFSFSGIFLNHRKQWHPSQYECASKDFTVAAVENPKSIDEAFVKKISAQQGVQEPFRRFNVKEKQLKISYPKNDIEIDLAIGKGKVITYKATPLLSQLTKLHVDTSDWWIYYSDIFAVAMLVIAFTGMFIQKGKNSFSVRGWKLALAGIIFPLIFLFIIG